MAENSNLAQLYQNILDGNEIRGSLISIREKIKDESLRRKFMYLLGGDFSSLAGLLSDEDPKVRRSAALILGMTEDEDVLPALVDAWKREKTLFVREDYLKAMENLNYESCLPELRKRLAEIDEGNADEETARDPLWDNSTHLAGEGSRIRKMLERYEKKRNHTFSEFDPAPDLILICNRCQVSATAAQITSGEVKAMNGAVHVRRGNLKELAKIRTWSECLFPIPGARPVPADERKAAEKLHEMKLYGFLKYLHGGEEGPYRYRVELKGRKELKDRKGEFIRGFCARLDMLEKGKLQNSDSDYEAELRLIERSDGTLAPMLKLYTLRDSRFLYRKKSTAQSMSPVNAALVVRLALPYLREHAQVLDPFCGTGTLLIERELISPSGTCYGIDKFGDAILKARENTGKIGHVNYINRDFFDFTHDHLFDELITELPETEPGREEMFMEHFLRYAGEFLADRAEVIVVTRNPKVFERTAKGQQDYVLQEKFLLNERLQMTEFIYQYHRT